MNLEVKFRIITIYGGKENIKITLQYIQDKKKGSNVERNMK